MDRRFRLAAAAAACVMTLTFSAVAYAYVTTDLTNWNLTETTSTWGSQFHVATGTNGVVSYRWLDTPAKITVVSGNACPDWSLYGSPATIGVNDTSYKALFGGYQGLCFVLRGRTAAGQGSMVNHDGRVQR